MAMLGSMYQKIEKLVLVLIAVFSEIHDDHGTGRWFSGQ
jgi:hypothetical protein